jgi:hypothetical protein
MLKRKVGFLLSEGVNQGIPESLRNKEENSY